MSDFCVQSDLEAVADLRMIAELADDDGDGAVSGVPETVAVTKAIHHACNKLRARLGLKYSEAQLAASDVMTTIAVFYSLKQLSGRRGLSPRYQAEFDYWEAFVVRVEEGKTRLPDTAMRAEPAPAMTNQGYAPGWPNPVVNNPITTPVNPVRPYPSNTDPFGGWRP